MAPQPSTTTTTKLAGSPGLVPQWENIIQKDGFYVNWSIASAAPVAAASTTVPIFTPRFGCRVIAYGLSWNPVCTGTGAIGLERLVNAAVPGAGLPLSTSPFPMTGTANVVTWFVSTALTSANCVLNVGDRLGVYTTGTLTSLTQILVTAYLVPLNRGSYKQP